MIATIYQKIEEHLTAAAYFSGFNFFRSDSDKSQGKQNKAKTPYLRLVFLRENLLSSSNRSHGQNSVRFRLDVAKNTDATEKDDFQRVTEVGEIVTAVRKSLTTPQDYELLNLQAVRDVRIAAAYENLNDIARVDLQLLSLEIEVDYFIQLG